MSKLMTTKTEALHARRVARVQATAKTLARARKDRDAAIVAAREAGLPLRSIADAAGVTHRTIMQVLARAEA